jgi:hypothetical protein
MKKLYLISLTFLLSVPAFSQIGLSVHLKRSQSENDITLIVDTLKIYKNNILYKNISHPDLIALYENVQNGEYKFCYNNLFGEKIEKVVTLSEVYNKLGGQEINLYVDQLQNPKSKNLLVQNLKNNETLTINIKFSGCFNSGADSIIVYKKNDYYFLKYKSKKIKLNTKDIEALVKYETELKSLTEVDFVSTTNAFNEIIVNEEKFTYHEPSMFWGGFTILKNALNLK